MKITFLCGSLERGKDGVGDYTRLLAKEVSTYGHPVVVISISDKAAFNTIIEETNKDVNFSIIRSNALFQKNQFEDIKKIIANFQPDIISLQYVPYSFNSYGTPLFLARKLKNIYTGNLWHIMVHEPFLSNKNSSFKNRFVRQLQIISLRLLKDYLKPIVWHTSIQYYQKQLFNSASITCKILGLFGNIPVAGFNNTISKNIDANTFTAVYFGAVPQQKNYRIFAEQLSNQLKNLDVVLKIIFCGKGGANEQAFHQVMQNTLAASPHTVSCAGQLPAEKLNRLFSSADFGIARVAPYLLGKSGSAIVMLEHGLPLWIPMATTELIEDCIDFRPELCYTQINKIVAFQVKKIQIKRLPVIAETFIADLGG